MLILKESPQKGFLIYKGLLINAIPEIVRHVKDNYPDMVSVIRNKNSPIGKINNVSLKWKTLWDLFVDRVKVPVTTRVEVYLNLNKKFPIYVVWARGTSGQFKELPINLELQAWGKPNARRKFNNRYTTY